MPYFQYNIQSHLLRPPTIATGPYIAYVPGTTVTTPPIIANGTSSSLPPLSYFPNGFDGTAVNYNFYNLAASATDNTTRLGLLEARSLFSGSPQVGYVTYNGLQESQANFYGGQTLTFNQTGSPLVIAYSPNFTFSSSAKWGFRIAAFGAIAYSNSTGGVNTTNTQYTNIKFDGTNSFYPSGGDPAAISTNNTTFLTYINSCLTQSINTTNILDRMAILGVGNPATTNFSTTWNTIGSSTPRGFYVYWNDGYYNTLIPGGTTTNVALVVVTTTPSATNTSIASILSASMLSAITLASGLSLSVNIVADPTNGGTTIDFIGNGAWRTNSLQSAGGVYEVTLVPVASPVTIGAITVPADAGNGILNWLGWSPSSSTTPLRVFDYAKLLNFSFNSSNNLIATGTDAYFPIAINDGITSLSYPGFFNNFGMITTSGSTYYHTRLPISSWNTNLNYGGNLNLSSLNVIGTSTFGGAVTFNGAVTLTTNNLTVPGGLTVTPQFTSGGAFAINSVVAVQQTTGGVIQADMSSTNAFHGIGIAKTASTGVGQTISVTTQGLVTGVGSGWNPGDPVFLYVLGTMTQNTALIGTGNIRQVLGIAVNATDIMLSPEEPQLIVDPGVVTSVKASYYGIGTAVTITTSPAVIPFTTKYNDASSAYNTSTGQFIAPVAGTYLVSCSINATDTLAVGTQTYTLALFSATEIYSTKVANGAAGSASIGTGIHASATFTLAQGAYVSVSLVCSTSSGTPTVPLGAANTYQYIEVNKIGV
jgi:hypothetical protein